MSARRRVPDVSSADQVLAILRDGQGSMNATEIGKSLAFIWVSVCNEQLGERCFGGERHGKHTPGFELAGTVVHLDTREGTTGHAAREVLNRLLAAGLVTREKVDRRVMWSLSPAYVAEMRDVSTRAAVILAGLGVAR